MLTLASVPPLPAPPPLARFLFEQPLPVALGLFAAAIILRIALARQGRDAVGQRVGWALTVAAIVVYTVGALVKTDREIVAQATRSLVRAAALGDSAGLSPLLADRVTLAVGAIESDAFSRPDVLTLVDGVQSRYPIRDVAIGELQTHVPQKDRAVTQVWARVDPREWYPTPTVWRIEWRRSPEGVWTADAIKCLLINGRTPGGEVGAFIFRSR